MRKAILIIILLSAFGIAAQAEDRSFQRDEFVLYNHEGKVQYGSIINNQNQDFVYINRKYHNGAGWVSGNVKVPSSELTKPTESLEHTLQGKKQILKKGMIVLGKNKKMYFIEDVFADGRIAVNELSINPVSRFRFNGNFVKEARPGVSIISKEDIQAVETKCFLGYCKGQNYKNIQNIPICDREALATYKLPPEMRRSGFKGISCRYNQFTIHAMFSDGTVVVFSNIFNPFPTSIHNYQAEPPSPPADSEI